MWDKASIDEVNNLGHEILLSGTMIEPFTGHISNCGTSIKSFDEKTAKIIKM